MSGFLNLHELESLAHDRLSDVLDAHVRGGSGDEWTLRENRDAWARHPILPRAYAGLDKVDISTRILDERLSLPVLVAPSGGHGAFCPAAEAASAAATKAQGALFVVSSWSTLPLEEVARHAGPRWFQFYQPEDPGLARHLLHRAREAGYTAIVHTVDVTVAGNRETSMRHGHAWTGDIRPGNFPGYIPLKRDLDWADLEFVQSESGLPVIPKGILHPDDAQQAVRSGAAALWLSNHGGRQLDGAPSALSMLPVIARGLKEKRNVPLIVDGGVRRGQDIFRAIALGATAVALGRPIIHGLVANGEAGVSDAIACLRRELEMTMQLAGTATIDAIASGSCLAGTPAQS